MAVTPREDGGFDLLDDETGAVVGSYGGGGNVDVPEQEKILDDRELALQLAQEFGMGGSIDEAQAVKAGLTGRAPEPPPPPADGGQPPPPPPPPADTPNPQTEVWRQAALKQIAASESNAHATPTTASKFDQYASVPLSVRDNFGKTKAEVALEDDKAGGPPLARSAVPGGSSENQDPLAPVVHGTIAGLVDPNRPRYYVKGTPAMDIKTGEQVQTRDGPPEQLVQGLIATKKAEADATIEAAAARAAGYDELAKVHGKAAQKHLEDLEDMEMARRAKQANIDLHMSVVQGRIAELKESAEENPVDRYWSKKGGLGTVLAKIGMALGAGAAALTGGPNHAADMIAGEIQNEMKHQQMKLETDLSGIAAYQTLLGQLRAELPSPEAALTATQALLQQSMAQEVARITAIAKSPEERANGMALANKLQSDVNASLTKLYSEISAVRTVKTKHQQARAGGMAGGPMHPLEAIKKGAKMVGMTPEKFIKRFYPSQDEDLPPATRLQKANEERNRLIQLPDSLKGTEFDPNRGTENAGHLFGLGSDTELAKVREKITAQDRLLMVATELDRLVRTHGTKVKTDLELRGRTRTLAAYMLSQGRPAGETFEASTIGELRFLAQPMTGVESVASLTDHIATMRGHLKVILPTMKANLARTVRGLTITPDGGAPAMAYNFIPKKAVPVAAPYDGILPEVGEEGLLKKKE